MYYPGELTLYLDQTCDFPGKICRRGYPVEVTLGKEFDFGSQTFPGKPSRPCLLLRGKVYVSVLFNCFT
jgi:hypothetical protein